MNLWGKTGIVVFILALTGGMMTPAECKERTFVIGDNSTLNTLDPAFMGVAQDIMNARNIYQGLVRYKRNTDILEGDLAKSWTVSKDGLVYTFKLRDDVTWHKGFGKFTARDVKFTFDRVLDPKTGASTRSEIVNDIQEVRIVDEFTVEFRLKSPTPGFLHKLPGPRATAILSQKAVEKYGKDYGRNPVGTGPFVFESWTREQVVYAANKEYREGPPKIDRLIFRIVPDIDTLVLALQNGDIDVVFAMPREPALLDRVKAAGCNITYRKAPSSQNLMMNTKKKPFDDVRVRRAIAHAVDKDVILKYVMGGFGERLDSPFPQGLYGHTESGIARYDHNPEKAKELLTQAGYPNGFEVNLDTSTSPNHNPVCVAVSDQLRKVNINAKLVVTDQATWWGKFSKGTTDFSTMVISWQPAAELSLLRFFHSSAFSPGLNICRYDKIDDLVEKARKEPNDGRRKDYYVQIQKQFMEDIPSVPLMNFFYPMAHRSHISGLSELDFLFWGDDVYSLNIGEKK
ncbi:MAG TPA: ABC transporter substrate-binding protein [Thermodesulfobacteriota bacterium]|nr:ABC transporter substrate-binding protein [Thermodesulfobacteriota bacterium]